MSLKRALLSGALAAPLAAPSLRVARAAEAVRFLAPAPPSLPANKIVQQAVPIDALYTKASLT